MRERDEPVAKNSLCIEAVKGYVEIISSPRAVLEKLVEVTVLKEFKSEPLGRNE
jgi:hypothetical protein